METITYLACPYSHEDKLVEEMRFEIANFVASSLMKQGEIVFSPISHTHPMVKYGLPTDWGYWKSQDTAFLNKCNKIKVIKVVGWDKSSGVHAETEQMRKRGIFAEYIDPFELDGFHEFVTKLIAKLHSRKEVIK